MPPNDNFAHLSAMRRCLPTSRGIAEMTSTARIETPTEMVATDPRAVFKSDPTWSGPLVYGPSANGKLRVLADALNGVTLNDLGSFKKLDAHWRHFSTAILDWALAQKRQVVLDLTHVKELDEVLAGHAYKGCVTTTELRHVRRKWEAFSPRMCVCDVPPWCPR